MPPGLSPHKTKSRSDIFAGKRTGKSTGFASIESWKISFTSIKGDFLSATERFNPKDILVVLVALIFKLFIKS